MTRSQQTPRRRLTLGAFGPFLVAVTEVVVFVLVGNIIGFGYAILLALATSVLGLWLMRRAGFRAWRSLRAAANQANLGTAAQPDPAGTAWESSPEEKIADAGVTLLAGAALAMPGFVTDAVALSLLIPPVRKSVGRRLAAAALRTLPSRGPRRSGAQGGSDVVEGEVVGEAGRTSPEAKNQLRGEIRDPLRPDPTQQDEG